MTVRNTAPSGPDRRTTPAPLRRRGGGDRLLSYRDGRAWHHVSDDDVNAYLKEVAGAPRSRAASPPPTVLSSAPCCACLPQIKGQVSPLRTPRSGARRGDHS